MKKLKRRLFPIEISECVTKTNNPDQVDYIKGRYIVQNIRIIDNIQNSAISKFPGNIVLVDSKKVFDSVELSF